MDGLGDTLADLEDLQLFGERPHHLHLIFAGVA
jgi:hypothetical protein